MISDELARLIKDGYNALGELEFKKSSTDTVFTIGPIGIL